MHRVLLAQNFYSPSDEARINFMRQTPNVDFFLDSQSVTGRISMVSNPVYITLLDAPVDDSDVTALLAFVGFSKASIMSW